MAITWMAHGYRMGCIIAIYSPVCHVVLTGTAEERNSHAEACLTSGQVMVITWMAHGRLLHEGRRGGEGWVIF